MKRIVQFHITKGRKQYVAQGVDVPIVTQAKTLDELTRNIQEATDLYFDGEKPQASGFATSPSVLVNFELPTSVHA